MNTNVIDQKPRDTKERLTSEQLSQLVMHLHENRTAPPTCGNYAEVVRGPKAKLQAKMFGKFLGYTPKPRPEFGKRIEMAMWMGDPLCDAALLKMADLGENPHAVIEAMVTKGIDAVANPSDELRQLWEQISTVPDWVNWDQIERGARFYRRYGVQGFTFQGVASFDSYRWESISGPLMSTGQYSDDTAFNRFLLTCNFWMEVSEPGGMRQYAPGWQVAVRVRMLHTLIRRAVIGSGRWDVERAGMPINQVGLHGAPVVSSIMLGQYLKLLGYRPKDQEIADVTHLWRYIAYLMGCTTEFFPDSVEDGIQVLYDMFNTEYQTESEDAIRLCRSFLAAFEPKPGSRGWQRLKDWLHYKSIVGQTLLFVSPETVKVARLPNPLVWGVLFTLLQAPRNFLQDILRHRFPSYAKRLDTRKRNERRAWVTKYLKAADLVYRPQPKY